LEESLNIGVLIYFHNTQKFIFKYSKTLSRIKSIYDGVPEKTIKEHIRQIDKFLIKYQKDKENLFPLDSLDLNQFLSQKVLPNDSSVLQFCKFKTEFVRGFSEEFLKSIILDRFFVEDIKVSKYFSQEPRLINNLFKNLKLSGFENFKNRNSRFKEDYILTNESGTEYKFDVAWQNGTLNLIKPIGFDLKEARNIANKAHKNFGQFYDLREEAISQGLRYDLIIGKPSNKNLFKEFDHSIELLSTLKHVSIVDESKLKEYSEKIISAIT
jgi:hypothetical protein